MPRLPRTAGPQRHRASCDDGTSWPDLVETERVREASEVVGPSEGALGVVRPIHKASNELGSTMRHQPQGAIQCTQELHSGGTFWPTLEFEHPSLLHFDAFARFNDAPIGAGKPSILVVFGHAPSSVQLAGIIRLALFRSFITTLIPWSVGTVDD